MIVLPTALEYRAARWATSKYVELCLESNPVPQGCEYMPSELYRSTNTRSNVQTTATRTQLQEKKADTLVSNVIWEGDEEDEIIYNIVSSISTTQPSGLVKTHVRSCAQEARGSNLPEQTSSTLASIPSGN